ncbi:hypothetical protein [Paraburkholderia caffeinilytica]|uniref:Uncharacterized protein n=1 Tax=Paraburkholderia caffeinilytica TaxID=1761016 RepID=A0ABQ1LL63_9BURK|nr:hypothetical protein [Paraburkholderia caffeinilytica]GGC26225.1 hypothetical protein GCM10011400_10830 [Paraburkholderia caffeinilytica]CAB3807803.1 hypothetical protein LMG28690_06899 [Paraburkholderia caffeinilytica]
MSRISKMQIPDSDIETLPDSSAVPANESEKTSNVLLLDAVVILSKANGINVVQLGARLAVVGELLVSVLAHLPVSMRADIVKSFRDRIEELMSLSDDWSLPESYHSALLSEVNRYLNAHASLLP